MREFLAIVGDTWQQSRQQVVFIIMCVLLAVIAVVMIGYPKMHTADDGTKQFGLQFMDNPVSWPAEAWQETAVQSRMVKRDERVISFDPDDMEEVATRTEVVRQEFEADAAEIGDLQRSVEFWAWIAATVVFSISMLLFIGASAGYFPDLLQTGAVDVVLAKPLTRIQVFLGKYFGGLVLYALAIGATYTLIAVGLGLRTGFYPFGLLQTIPLQVFAAAVLYAIISLFGVLTRSTALSVLVGYVFYLVIDTAVSTAGGLQTAGVSEDLPLLDKFLSIAHYLPSLGFLKEVAVNSCIYMQPFEPRPVIVAAVWLVITLSLGYWKFRRTDF